VYGQEVARGYIGGHTHEKPKVTKIVPSKDQVTRFYYALNDSIAETMFLALASTGLRKNEVLSLRIGLWLIEAQERRVGYWLSKKGLTYYRRTKTPPVKPGELVKSGERNEGCTAREVVQSTQERRYQVLKLIRALNAKSFSGILEKIIRAWK